MFLSISEPLFPKMILVLLAIFGLVALVLWLGETLWSIIQTIRSILAPFFQPQEARTLRERYGDWAGEL